MFLVSIYADCADFHVMPSYKPLSFNTTGAGHIMAWKRSSVRSRSGPPIIRLAEPSQANRLGQGLCHPPAIFLLFARVALAIRFVSMRTCGYLSSIRRLTEEERENEEDSDDGGDHSSYDDAG